MSPSAMANGIPITNGTSKDKEISDDDLAVQEIRKLVIDICRQNGGGHGGSAIGMAPLFVALWRHAMRYNPQNPSWFDRDRFVLSNGHAAMGLYTMLHVAGYPEMIVDELKMYADPKAVDPETGKWKSTICHGHPEIEVPGVEVTTGPLGQGVANAVGLAIASKNLAAQFNRPGHEVVSSKIYCTTGDGCLQEGVAQEALAVAGNLGLSNLVLLYDNNGVTCDGPLDWIVSEDVNAKVKAFGWDVIDVYDGDTNVESIKAALTLFKASRTKPLMLNIRTTIGYNTSTAGTFKSHHGTYTDDDAAAVQSQDVSSTHELSSRTKKYFDGSREAGAKVEKDWNDLLASYSKEYPEDAAAFKARMDGTFGDYDKLLAGIDAASKAGDATRTFNGAVFNELMETMPNMFAGGADLWNSNQMGDQSSLIMDQAHPDGRVVRWGIREHAMASINNGLAAYSPGTFLPVTATFLMFYLYAAAGVRMGALSHLQVVHIATHDSIGEGQNGPTHQPVELDSLFRAMPNLLYIRPSDSEEVLGAWKMALAAKKAPSVISLARDPSKFSVSGTSRDKVLKGGYVIKEASDATVTLISCGSELQFALVAAEKLSEAGIATRVVSMPCIQVFEQQSEDYIDSVLSQTPHIISVEAYISSMWSRFANASIAMDSFGYSGAGYENFVRFGLDPDSIVRKVRTHVESSGKKGARRWKLLK